MSEFATSAGAGRTSTTDAEPSRSTAEVKPETAKKGGRSKPPTIGTVRELLDHAYSLGGKQIRISQKVLKDVAANSSIEDFGEDALLERVDTLMAGDPLLAVPPRLLVALEEGAAATSFKTRVARLIRHALRVHPLYALPRFHGAPGGPEVPDLDGADLDTLSVRLKLRAAEISAGELGMAANSIKPTERERLGANVVTTVALVASVLDDWSVRQLVSYLQRHLWKETLTRPGAPNLRVVVSESAQPEALGAVAQVYISAVEKAERDASESERKARVAAEQVENLLSRSASADEEIARLRGVIEARESEIAALRDQAESLDAQVDAERRDRVIDRGHHIDDYEVLRTRIMRSLRKQVELLSDGLHAVRNQSYSVTEEYVERALESLSKELRDLNDKGES